MLGVQDLGLVLGKIMQRHAVAFLSRPGLERQHACQQFQQGAFPRAVFADQRDALPAFDGKLKAFVDDVVTVLFADVVQFQHLDPALGGLRKPEPEPFGVPLGFQEFDFLQLFDARLNLFGFGRLIPEAIHKFLNARDLLGLTLCGRRLLGIELCAQGLKGSVIAAVFLDLTMTDFPDVRGQAIKKFRIVADDEHGHFRGEEKGFEPGLRGFVQVVRGLVQQQHVGVRKQQMPESHPHTIAAGEGLQGSMPVRLSKSEPR